MYPVLGHLSIQQFLTLNTHWNWIQCINAADRTKKHDLKWLTYTVVITTDCMTIQDKAIVNTFKNQVWAGGHNTDEWTSTKSLHNFRNVGYNITHNHFGENTTIYCMMLHIEHSCKTFCCFFPFYINMWNLLCDPTMCTLCTLNTIRISHYYVWHWHWMLLLTVNH